MKFLLMGLVVSGMAVLGPLAFAQGGAPGGDGFEIGARLQPGAGEVPGGFREISWDDLIPPDWLPEDLFAGMFDDVDPDTLDDFDPRAMELMEKIREVWDSAPVVERMHGERIRIPGFVVPLEGDDENIHEFLLVPYFGACIHVPPPPANQLIHVLPDAAIPARWNMAPVWVNGVLSVARFDSELGNAGYQLRALEVEAYEEPLPR